MRDWAIHILSCKRANARCSLHALAESTKTPQSTIYERSRSCDRYITRHTVLLDFRKLGLVQYAFLIRLFHGKQRQAKELLERDRRINGLFRLSGSDLLGEAVFSDGTEAERFFDRLDGMMLGSIERFLIEDIKREAYMPGGARWEQ
jgi:DNA-binding Lrp family transcriptional regulator